MSISVVGLESVLLLINLVLILIFVILKKRLILTILVPIAIFQPKPIVSRLPMPRMQWLQNRKR